jgi:shikimate dehydrogenase
MKNFAVIGNPVAHSKSPAIFSSLFRHFGIEANYLRISLEKAGDLLPIMAKYNISGVNITSPFKEDVFRVLKNTDDISRSLNAVNVVLNKNGSLYGFNTDVYGVKHSIINSGIDVINKKCVVLGAGGAAKSAVYALKELQASAFTCNRTDSKAEKISCELKCGFIKYDDLKKNLKDTFLLVLTVPEISIDIKDDVRDVVVLNADYRSDELKTYCRRYISGYEWLIYQALRTFEIFFDRKADACEVREELSVPDSRRNIAIIGPSGSGKTVYGKIIAGRFGMDYFDTDAEIEKHAGKKISDIFRMDGEEHFRRQEESVIAKACGNENTVISAGGGALISAANREILRKNCFVVLLDIETDLVLSRLNEDEISKRPKLREGSLKEGLEKMFNERKQDYVSSADLIVSITSNDRDAESEKIIRELDAGKHFYK